LVFCLLEDGAGGVWAVLLARVTYFHIAVRKEDNFDYDGHNRAVGKRPGEQHLQDNEGDWFATRHL